MFDHPTMLYREREARNQALRAELAELQLAEHLQTRSALFHVRVTYTLGQALVTLGARLVRYARPVEEAAALWS